jgi:hypothetical protein
MSLTKLVIILREHGDAEGISLIAPNYVQVGRSARVVVLFY